MIKLSSIIIAKDEELNIAQCIRSQLNCVDEIIVLIDSESKDRTLEIVRSFPEVKCHTSSWMGYAKTKEYAVTLTSSDWILWIDADEELTPELSAEIIAFKNRNQEYSAYSIPRRAFFLGKWIKHSGWYPGRVTRVFNKNKCKFNQNSVHEELIVNGNIGRLNNDIDHYTDPNIHHYFMKFNRYTTLAAGELDKKGKSFLVTDIILRPVSIFIKMYFVKRGFLDGIHGFILAVFSSAYVFTKYSKLWEIQNARKKND